jgi:hypothetical protein
MEQLNLFEIPITIPIITSEKLLVKYCKKCKEALSWKVIYSTKKIKIKPWFDYKLFDIESPENEEGFNLRLRCRCT